jgi:predicted nuclease of predicted toxin-antitoxin system
MKFLLDVNMPRSTKAALDQRGFDAVAVRDILPPATPDSVIYDLAKQEGRLLVTRDHDFLNILLYPPAQTPGIIVVKTQHLTARAINALLCDFLSRVTEPQIQNTLVVLEPHRYRVLR